MRKAAYLRLQELFSRASLYHACGSIHRARDAYIKLLLMRLSTNIDSLRLAARSNSDTVLVQSVKQESRTSVKWCLSFWGRRAERDVADVNFSTVPLVRSELRNNIPGHADIRPVGNGMFDCLAKLLSKCLQAGEAKWLACLQHCWKHKILQEACIVNCAELNRQPAIRTRHVQWDGCMNPQTLSFVRSPNRSLDVEGSISIWTKSMRSAGFGVTQENSGLEQKQHIQISCMIWHLFITFQIIERQHGTKGMSHTVLPIPLFPLTDLTALETAQSQQREGGCIYAKGSQRTVAVHWDTTCLVAIDDTAVGCRLRGTHSRLPRGYFSCSPTSAKAMQAAMEKPKIGKTRRGVWRWVCILFRMLYGTGCCTNTHSELVVPPIRLTHALNILLVQNSWLGSMSSIDYRVLSDRIPSTRTSFNASEWHS